MYYSFYSLKVLGAGIVIVLLRGLYGNSKVLTVASDFILLILLGYTVKIFFSLAYRILRDLNKNKDLAYYLASLLRKGFHYHQNGQERTDKEQAALLVGFQKAADEGLERLKGHIQNKNKNRDSASGHSSSSLIHNTKEENKKSRQ